MALINGRSYDFAGIVITIMNVPITGVQEITYEEEQEKTNNLGTGRRANSRGHGAIVSSASIGLSMNEVEKLRDASVAAGNASGSLLLLEPFNLNVTYLNAQRAVTHKLKNCEFTKDMGGGSVGDTEIAGVFDLIVSDIEYR